jgi:multiple sugar transport system ATP-binding protein
MAEIRLTEVTKRFPDGTTAVDGLSLDVADGEFLILVGPSGCGKTTALRMVAGLEQASEGEIRIGSRVVNDVPPVERDVAMVFQSYALYPHMKVRDNIGFPLRLRRTPKARIDGEVADAARLLDVEALLDRRPRELSGGQRQRVAMGRAIVRNPQAFLMDEPLSNLDAKLRVQMRAHLAGLHQRLGITTLYVTHDQTEALTLGQRIAVLRDGVIQQLGTPRQLYDEPANAFVARFIGSPPMNFLRGFLRDGRLEIAGREHALSAAARARAGAGAGPVLCGIRPESFAPADPRDPDALVLAGEVRVVESLGSDTYLYVAAPDFESADLGEPPVGLEDTVAARLDRSVRAEPGDRVALAVTVEEMHFFDPSTGVNRR